MSSPSTSRARRVAARISTQPAVARAWMKIDPDYSCSL